MSIIVPIILAGGSGSRLWPLSRSSYPKQFSRTLSDLSLFQQTCCRLEKAGLNLAEPIVVTHEDFRFLTMMQCSEVGVDPTEIIVEPSPRDTAASVLAGCEVANKLFKDPLVLVVPSDHEIIDEDAFFKAVDTAAEYVHVEPESVVTFGIVPNRIETGYGYIEFDSAKDRRIHPVLSFVEKPNWDTAENMVGSGNYLWNAGIILAHASNLLSAGLQYQNILTENVINAVENAQSDLGFIRLSPEDWDLCLNISIDYAIMEKLTTLNVMPIDAGWSDLGDFDAVWRTRNKNEAGIVTSGPAYAFNCSDSLLIAENDNQVLVVSDLDNIIAVAMKDAVLVADRRRPQAIKQVQANLRTAGVIQADNLPVDHRPWGWFESLVKGPRFQVKRIYVNPGASLSLQSHQHRSEHWVVVEGTATVQIADSIMTISEGKSIYVPLGEKHRLENLGKLPLIVIEVQIGAYLGEDDITRYNDVYKRI